MSSRGRTRTVELVRFSRDGDQFHYSWAARRCLKLLSPTTDLVAVTIEGASSADSATGSDAGTEVIDVAEYHGSESASTATLVRYVQLKHSTLHSRVAWSPSGLKKTLAGFAKRYVALAPTVVARKTDDHLQFCFVSNRPIQSEFVEAIEDAAAGRPSRHPALLAKIRTFTKLKGATLAAFCRRLRLLDKEENYSAQRLGLAEDIKSYLPGDDADAPVQLKELVTRKATSDFAANPTIRRTDVLRALRVTEVNLFPAPARLESVDNSIPRVQEPDLAARIIASSGTVVVHAAGGVGKSIFAQRLKFYLPVHSVHVVYDCFGHGEYRRPGSPRHRHKDALVHIANELASYGLCDPLVPSSHADRTDYLKAFAHRIRQAAAAVMQKQSNALVCICIDAADNADIAARESGWERSFARDLIRETPVSGVRLIFLCRTERQQKYLDPPLGMLSLELDPFTVPETAAFLRRTYPAATDHDVIEFHRLTSQNPRVQVTALAQQGPLSNILRSLGPSPTTVDATIAGLLERAIADTREKLGPEGAIHVDTVCAALAILRPLVPIDVLAAVAETSPAAIRSFAVDFGRPLLVTDDAVQFRDEPVETWFRDRFRPSAASLATFVARLRPFASRSAYVASTLPQLMLEAGQLDELVSLALTSADLPSNNPVERRDIELQRLQFALRASLRARNFTAAAKLAFRAGGETTGDARQRKLFQENTDLVATLVESQRVHELVSRRTFGSRWLGSHHAYDAALLSFHNAFLGEARSSLRMAEEWLRNWSQLNKDERKQEAVSDDDIAELAMAHLNVHGAQAAAASLAVWRPREVSFRAGKRLARRLADHCRWNDLDALAREARNDACLLLAVVLETQTLNRVPPQPSVARALRFLLNPRFVVRESNSLGSDDVLDAVVALVRSAARQQAAEPAALASLLSRYLPENPPRTLASRHGGNRRALLSAYCLRAALLGKDLQLTDLADPELRKELTDSKSQRDTSERRDFYELVGSVFPWHQLRTSLSLKRLGAEDLIKRVAEAEAESTRAIGNSYQDYQPTVGEIAELWLDVLVLSESSALVPGLMDWIGRRNRPLFTPTLTRLARLCARSPGFEGHAFTFAKQAYDLARNAREDAESEATTYIDLARAIFVIDAGEAKAYFGESVSIAGKLGDEILDRWSAVLDLAERAANEENGDPETAYQLGRCTEVAYRYVVRDKHFDWSGTVTALAGLCSSSCLAILSRWRDRGFGSSDRLLPAALAALLDRRDVDPIAAAALIGFRASWRHPSLLRRCLSAVGERDTKQAILDLHVGYMRLDQQSASVWTEVKALAAEHGLGVVGIDQWVKFEELAASATRASSYSVVDGQAPKDEVSWPAVFEGLAVHNQASIVEAYRRFKTLKPPFYHERFFQEMCFRVGAGHEGECVRALTNVPTFDLYQCVRFFEGIPSTWLERLAVRSELAALATILYRRHCLEVTRGREYQRLPLELVSRVTGLSEGILIDEVLSALADTAAPFDAGRLFTMVGLLAPRLSQPEALEALRYSLAQFDDVMQQEDGDGPWTQQLAPPADTATALAGYIFAALGAPTADTRWEAAHVVRGLCALGCRTVLDPIIGFAASGRANAFADAGLHFYVLHARQWLLIALSRGALESSSNVAPYLDFLLRSALSDGSHVLIRHFAAVAVLALADRNQVEIDQATRTRLLEVNRSALPKVSSKRWQRTRHQSPNNEAEPPGRTFTFDYDVAKYDLEALARCFGMQPSELERIAASILQDEWKLTLTGRWDEDARAKRGLLREHRSQSSRPKAESLDWYLSYHLMMTVAAKLQATVPLHEDPEDPEEEYSDWLRRYVLARGDGRWLADRRDPRPCDWPDWKSEKTSDHWRWSVSSADLDRALGLDMAVLNVWSWWKSIEGQREETVHVSTALVSPNQAGALLRAFQTASDPHDYRIPSANDDGAEFDRGPYRLQGWIEKGSDSSGVDDTDPWAGGISYPPQAPAELVRDLLNLSPDEDLRTWHVSGNAKVPAMTCQIWASGPPDSDWKSEGESGSRLLASRTMLDALLSKTGMALIAKVSIERRIRRYRHESGGDDFSILPYFKIFVLTADGTIHTLTGHN